MSYRIAVGTSNGTDVDLKFGEVKKFWIYEAQGEQYQLLEVREIQTGCQDSINQTEAGISSSHDTKAGTDCHGGSGCQGAGTGCSGGSNIQEKVALISDCRCVVCKKVGFQAQKQFERKVISVFDIECEVQEGLTKIVHYYNRVDRHESIAKKFLTE